jgi:hypothetical protein
VSGKVRSIAPGRRRNCCRVGDGDGDSAGVTAIRGADGVGGGEGDVAPFMALMTEARGDDDGAGEGRVSLSVDGDPNSEVGVPTADEVFLSAISARGRR